MRLFGVFRFVNANQFHFRELMQTVQSAHIFSIRAGFATETLRIGAVLDRQLLFIEDNITVDISNRDFGCRDQIKIIHFAMIHLPFLVRQLARTITGSSIHNCRRHDFRITGFTGFIQEEVNQRTLQLRTLSLVNRETGTCDLHSQVKIDQVIFLCQFPMGQCVFRQFRFHTAHLFNLIIVSSHTFGHFVVRNIRDCIEQVLHIFDRLIHFGLDSLVDFLDLSNTLLSNFGFLFFTFFHQHADGFRSLVHLCQIFI